MKKLKICLCVILSVLLAGGVMAPALAENDAPVKAAASTVITDVFSMDLFFNAAVNDFLKVFPRFSAMMEAALGIIMDRELPFDTGGSGSDPSINGTMEFYFNGSHGTDRLSEVLSNAGVNVYPVTLGAYLQNRGYNAIGNALYAAGYNWSLFTDENGNPAFDFDWGLDSIANPDQRFVAFFNVITEVINAAFPVFRTALGTATTALQFDGSTPGRDLMRALITEGTAAMSSGIFSSPITIDFSDAEMTDIRGQIEFGGLDLYQKVLIPLYRSLGLGTVIDYTFPTLSTNGDASTLAMAIYKPLFDLVKRVQNDPAVRGSLISYYHGSGAYQINQIGADWQGTFPMSIRIDDLEISGGSGTVGTLLQWNWVSDLLAQSVSDHFNYSVDILAEVFVSVGDLKARLAAELPALTETAPPEESTEPETEPTEPETEPTEPETEPTEPGTEPTEPATEPSTEAPDTDEDDDSNPFLRFLKNISDFFLRIVEWLKHLFGIS